MDKNISLGSSVVLFSISQGHFFGNQHKSKIDLQAILNVCQKISQNWMQALVPAGRCGTHNIECLQEEYWLQCR